VLPPCVEDGTVALAIRRARRTAPTLDDLGKGGIFADISPTAGGMTEADRALLRLYRDAQAGAVNERQARYGDFLRACVRARRTIIMCGQVGSGKTTFGMGLIQEIPLEDRLVFIQDTDEWNALPHPNRVNLFYSKGGQGAAQVTPNDLVEASLRLAMDWLAMQELRGAEAFSFLRARRSGHPGISTAHAESARAVFPALALMVRQHPAAASVELATIEQALRGVIDVVIHLHRPGGGFRISDIWFRLAEEGA
jgi:type IV secretion system protein VirB11